MGRRKQNRRRGSGTPRNDGILGGGAKEAKRKEGQWHTKKLWVLVQDLVLAVLVVVLSMQQLITKKWGLALFWLDWCGVLLPGV